MLPQQLLAFLDARRDDVIALQRHLVAIPALGPDNGGDGERLKAEYVSAYLHGLGFADIRQMPAPDSRVSCGFRPNLAAILPGRDTSRTFWTIAHLDVVPPGDLALWHSDPYILQVDGDALVGRGVEDNHQALVSAAMVAKGLLDLNLTPPMNFGICCVADEETGSHYGLGHLLDNHPDLFRPDDLILVPDFGQADGGLVEVAEKSMFWLKITVLGKQCHASVPHLGINTLVASAAFILRLKSLLQTYDARDELFDPPASTFEPTKKEANVENINTVPGRDVFYLDARILPCYQVDEVLARIRQLGAEIEAEYGVTIEYEPVQREQAAPPTPVEASIVQRLVRAIQAQTGVQPRPGGIGGGTVAALLRRKGLPAAVWSTLLHNAHQPNERAHLSHALSDAKVMARVLFED